MGRFERLFKARTKPFVGIDISAARVKLLELDGKPGAYRVLSYASEALPADAVSDHQIVDAEAVAGAIAGARERSGTRTRDAAIAVSGPSVFSKIIDMPADLDDAGMEEQIGFDAEQYIPHAIEEVNLDFQILERDPNNDGINRVLLVACRRDTIEMRMAAVEMGGFKVRLVDVEEYALQNACSLLVEQTPELSREQTIAVFDIGAQLTRLTVQQHGRSQYSREFSFGGHSMARMLMQRYELADTDQLRGRLRTGEIEASAIVDDMAQFADRATAQIERALQFYLSAATRDETIDRVVLAGGTTLYPGFEAAMRERLAWPLTLGNPLAGMLASTAARRNHVDLDAPALMVTAGLAMRAVG